jgi:hypothetical protein
MVITHRKRVSLFLHDITLFIPALLYRYCLGVDNVKGADAKFESDSGLHSRKKGGKQAPVAGVETAPWFKFDDDAVTKVDINAVLDSEAYILM